MSFAVSVKPLFPVALKRYSASRLIWRLANLRLPPELTILLTQLAWLPPYGLPPASSIFDLNAFYLHPREFFDFLPVLCAVQDNANFALHRSFPILALLAGLNCSHDQVSLDHNHLSFGCCGDHKFFWVNLPLETLAESAVHPPSLSSASGKRCNSNGAFQQAPVFLFPPFLLGLDKGANLRGPAVSEVCFRPTPAPALNITERIRTLTRLFFAVDTRFRAETFFFPRKKALSVQFSFWKLLWLLLFS